MAAVATVRRASHRRSRERRRMLYTYYKVFFRFNNQINIKKTASTTSPVSTTYIIYSVDIIVIINARNLMLLESTKHAHLLKIVQICFGNIGALILLLLHTFLYKCKLYLQ